MTVASRCREIAQRLDAGDLAVTTEQHRFIRAHRSEIWNMRRRQQASLEQPTCSKCNNTGMLDDDTVCDQCQGTGDSSYVPEEYPPGSDFNFDGDDDDSDDDNDDQKETDNGDQDDDDD
jgi:hypothetical protein